ncbi:MAG: AAA family ATPase [Methanoregula sp.]|nr:AAA family ATPase [Methanoregula sp.]
MKYAISSISISNYRQYHGKQTLDFKNDKIKNVSLILGKNGAGKSNLLNAITWCLYGIEIHKSKDNHDSSGMPVINTSALKSLKNNQNIIAEVIIHLATDIGPWTIKRTLEGGKSALGDFYFNEASKLTVIHPVYGQDKIDTGDDTQILINNLLPEALKNFFFIDGEQLREFFKVSTPENIAKAIDIVSQLELVYKAADHLSKVEGNLRKSVKNTTPQLERVLRNIELAQKNSEQLKDTIKQIDKQKEKDHEEITRVKEYLKSHSSAKISTLENERQSLETDVRKLNEQIGKKESQRNSYLVEIAPFIYLKKEIEDTYKIIEEKVEKGELPPRIKETFIRELLEKGHCICGNELVGNAKKTLEDYSKKITLSELSEISIVGKTTIEEIFSSIKEFPATIDSLNDEIDDFKEQLEKKERRLELISDEIKEYNIAEIRRYEERREELSRLIAKNEQLLILHNGELNTYDSTLKELKSEEEKELGKDKKNNSLKEKLTLVQSSLKVLANTEKIIKTKIRKQVEKNLNDNFKILIRKKTAFSSITIDEKYDVKVHHIDGYNVINDLSAGEYLILGLSFMSALMTISGFQAPVIIDTPLGKIDKEHREYITTELPKFLEGKQLILLVTPTEYDNNVKANLSQYLLNENFYQITENQDQTESKVGQYDGN